MKIVIDVGVIGLAQLFETARTGIYRVISSLTVELLRRSNINVHFSSLSSLQVYQLTQKYLSDAGFAEKVFPENKLERFLRSLAGKEENAPQDTIFAKVLSKVHRISLTRRIAISADIYHSHYSALPEFLGSHTPIKMLTVYDIIPLIHPEYFADGFVDEFRPIVESFSPEKDFLFTISKSTKEDICKHFSMDPERIFVTPLAASPDLYYPVQDDAMLKSVRRMFLIPEGRYFLTLATVEKRKNLKMSIDCFREIVNQPGNHDLYFVLVGTRGWKVKELVDEIEDDPLLRERVIFTGFVEDKYLSALYSGAEAFLYPSLYEGFGLPPLEAMQCGLPVITSNTSSLPEVVGDAGIMVDPFDKDAMCGAMHTLLNDRMMHEEYQKKGLKQATQFSWERCADATITGYTQAWNQR